MKTIVKVQTPIAGNNPIPLALIYNEDRSISLQMTKADLGDRVWNLTEVTGKAYFKADVWTQRERIGIRIGQRVTDRTW